MNRIFFGRFDTEDERSRVQSLHSYLSDIQRRYDWIRPPAEFKIVLDQYGQVQVELNDQMLRYMLVRFATTADDPPILDDPSAPPEWFMRLFDRPDLDN